MKKIFIVLLCLFFGSPCFAATISFDQIISPDGLTISAYNSNLNTVYNEVNGNLESVNIKDDTLTEADFADAINPRVRDYELLGDFTYTGHLPATSANLTSDISLGTSFVRGYRITTAATSKTYTASKDTWTFINSSGAFEYVEVANGAAAPTTPANSLLLATVITDGNNITSVTDRRSLVPPNLRIYQDYITGALIHRHASTATTINIDAGEIDFGTSGGRRRNTTTATVAFTATGTGGLDTGSLAAGRYYVFALPDPNNASNYVGIGSISSTDATGVTNERLIGTVYASTASSISTDVASITDNRSLVRSGIVQIVNFQTGAVATGTTTIPYDDTIPQNTEGTEFMSVRITPTNATNKLKIDIICYVADSANQLNNTVALFQDSVADALACGTSQQYATTGPVAPTVLTHYMVSGTTSETIFKVRIGPPSAATVTLNGTLGARRLGGTYASSITVTEIAQ